MCPLTEIHSSEPAPTCFTPHLVWYFSRWCPRQMQEGIRSSLIECEVVARRHHCCGNIGQTFVNRHNCRVLEVRGQIRHSVAARLEPDAPPLDPRNAPLVDGLRMHALPNHPRPAIELCDRLRQRDRNDRLLELFAG